MTDAFMGTIQPFGFNFAPKNWATCDGQILAISSNTALFSLLGTYYGGNGSSTFGLPDLRGRVGIHMGTAPGIGTYSIGELGGSPTTTLVTQNLPPHNHMMNVNAGPGTTNRPASNFLAQAFDGNNNGLNIYAPAASGGQLNPQAISMTGSSIPFANMQPYLVVNFSICMYGIYPSRN